MKTALAMLAVTLLATGCSETEQRRGNPLADPELPACADVWVVGEELPSVYEGCMEGDALVVVVVEGGDGHVGYDDRLVALPGGKIREVR